MNKKSVTNMVKLFMAGLCMILGLSFASAPVAVHAAGSASSGSYDISWIGGEGNGAFTQMEETVKQTGNSAYNLMMAIGAAGCLICIIILGIKLMANAGNGNKRAESLGAFVYVLIGGALIFGAVGAVGLLQNIGMNLF